MIGINRRSRLPWLQSVTNGYILCLGLAMIAAGAFPAAAGPSEGPVRLARINYYYGDVSWRADPSLSWTAASRNLPLRQGCQVWVPSGCRAELQFDDGSRLWLGDNALMTCQTLYSDSQGEFTELNLNDGAAECHLRHNHSLYQFNTPTVSCQSAGPARFRITTGDRTRIAVFNGAPVIEGPVGKTTLASGDYLDLRDPNTPYHILPLPERDRFDTWCDERDAVWDGYTRRHAYRTLPPNIAVVSGGLDDYGTWRRDPRYGEVWCPRVAHGWRPYRAGHWTWVDPYGWTWVSDEPWGWAPYHYGTWASFSFGWGWCPGPRYQPWCPAQVCFTDYGGSVGWCPISPAEIVYPSSLNIGFSGGDWSLFFSIGSAGYYYPTYQRTFVAGLWPASYCNAFTYAPNNVYVNNTTIVRSFTVNNNTYITDPRFVPVNARAGATIFADRSSFGSRGNFRLASGQESIAAFQKGRLVAAPAAGRQPVSGPQAVRPTLASISPTRQFKSSVPIARSTLERPVYRAPVRSQIAQTSAPMGRTLPANKSPKVLSRAALGAAAVGGAALIANRLSKRGGGPAVGAAPPGRPTPSTLPGGRQRMGTAPATGPGATAAQRAQRARANMGMRPGGGNIARPNMPGSGRQRITNAPGGARQGVTTVPGGGNRPRIAPGSGGGNRQRISGAPAGGSAAQRAQRARMQMGQRPGGGGATRVSGRPSGGTISSIQRRQQAVQSGRNRSQVTQRPSQQRQRQASRPQGGGGPQHPARPQRQSYRPQANAYRRQPRTVSRPQPRYTQRPAQSYHPHYAPSRPSGGGGGGRRSYSSAPRISNRPAQSYRPQISPYRRQSVSRPSVSPSRPSGGNARSAQPAPHGGGAAPRGGQGGGKHKRDG